VSRLQIAYRHNTNICMHFILQIDGAAAPIEMRVAASGGGGSASNSLPNVIGAYEH
jgi:hypothetical protein